MFGSGYYTGFTFIRKIFTKVRKFYLSYKSFRVPPPHKYFLNSSIPGSPLNRPLKNTQTNFEPEYVYSTPRNQTPPSKPVAPNFLYTSHFLLLRAPICSTNIQQLPNTQTVTHHKHIPNNKVPTPGHKSGPKCGRDKVREQDRAQKRAEMWTGAENKHGNKNGTKREQ